MNFAKTLNQIDTASSVGQNEDFNFINSGILQFDKMDMLNPLQRNESIQHHLNKSINLLKSLEQVLADHHADNSIVTFISTANILEGADYWIAPAILAMQGWGVECADDFETGYLEIYKLAEDIHWAAIDASPTRHLTCLLYTSPSPRDS